MANYKFQLYIAEKRTWTEAGAEIIKDFLAERLKEHYSFEVINVLDNPDLANEHDDFATPMLTIQVDESPLPVKQILGDFNSIKNALAVWFSTNIK